MAPNSVFMSVGLCNQVPNKNVTVELDIVTILFILLIWLSPKVITLSNFHNNDMFTEIILALPSLAFSYLNLPNLPWSYLILTNLSQVLTITSLQIRLIEC
jgi:hypothetical protein